MLWVVAIQIIRLLDKYHSTYLVQETHIIFRRSSAVPHANEHARDVTLCSATTPIRLTLRDISAITSGYSLINMYLFQFECKKGYKRDLYFN